MNSHSSIIVKILVINHGDEESKEIQSRLKAIQELLPPDVQIEIDQAKENIDPIKSAKYIKDGHYDLVLVSENITSSVWRVIQESPEFPKTPKFHLVGKLESLLDREIKQYEFS